MCAAVLTTYPQICIAYSSYVPQFVREHHDLIDYVEIPFELLQHDPSVIEVSKLKPVVLHCASLSIAGSVPPSQEALKMVQRWIKRTKTPWLGEHLSFITAERERAGFAVEYVADEPYNTGYAVSPPMNEAAVESVVGSVRECERWFDVPLLLENPPLYFAIPGSTMTQVEFINEVCQRSSVRLLLDLTHIYITS